MVAGGCRWKSQLGPFPAGPPAAWSPPSKRGPTTVSRSSAVAFLQQGAIAAWRVTPVPLGDPTTVWWGWPEIPLVGEGTALVGLMRLGHRPERKEAASTFAIASYCPCVLVLCPSQFSRAFGISRDPACSNDSSVPCPGWWHHCKSWPASDPDAAMAVFLSAAGCGPMAFHTIFKGVSQAQFSKIF